MAWWSGQQGRGPDILAEFSPEDHPQTPAEWHWFAFYLYGTAAGWSKEKCERKARLGWPLAYYKIHGIKQGMQWHVLGWLAARYARTFPTCQLADELWEVVQASPQNPRDPRRRRQIGDYAARARRFIEREDAKEAELLRQVSRWAERSRA